MSLASPPADAGSTAIKVSTSKNQPCPDEGPKRRRSSAVSDTTSSEESTNADSELAVVGDASNEVQELQLPSEIWVRIFTLLPFNAIIFVVPRVCRQWKNVCRDNLIAALEVPVTGRSDVNHMIQSCQVKAIVSRVRGISSARFPFCLALTRSVIQTLAVKPALSTLDLTGCKQVDNSWLEYIPMIAGIRKLVLRGCPRVGDEGISIVARGCCNTLRMLDISECSGITLDVISVLEQCTQLKDLRLCHNNEVDSIWLREIAHKLPQLTSIHVNWCRSVTDNDLAILIRGCPNLNPDSLLAGCKGDAFAEAVAECHPNLERINLFETRVTDRGLGILAEKCANLDPNSLNTFKKGDHFLRGLALSHRKLESLDLFDCDDVTDEGVLAIANRCPELTSICLFECNNLTDSGIAALMLGCPLLLPDDVKSYKKGDRFVAAAAATHPDLESIDLSLCRQVSDVGIRYLAAKCPQLKRINLRKCRKVSSGAVRDLVIRTSLEADVVVALRDQFGLNNFNS